jgi:predicted transcriptional regulator
MAKAERAETTTIRLLPTARAELDNIAKADKRSRSFLVQQIVEEWLRDHARRKLKKPS